MVAHHNAAPPAPPLATLAPHKHLHPRFYPHRTTSPSAVPPASCSPVFVRVYEKGKRRTFGTNKQKSQCPSRYACLFLLTAYLSLKRACLVLPSPQTSFIQTVNDATLDWIHPRHIAFLGLDLKGLKQEEYHQKQNCDVFVLRAGVVPFSTRYTPKSHRCFLTLHRMDTNLPEIDILSHVYTVL